MMDPWCKKKKSPAEVLRQEKPYFNVLFVLAKKRTFIGKLRDFIKNINFCGKCRDGTKNISLKIAIIIISFFLVIHNRYAKETWTKTKVLGKDFWFVDHLLYMVAALLLAFIGGIVIFVDRGFEPFEKEQVT